MNGKYMGFLERRWVSRDPDRLARMKERPDDYPCYSGSHWKPG